MDANTPEVSVYYDNSCPICREEIAALKSIDTHDALHLIDCSAEGFADAATSDAGLSQQTLKESLHVRDSSGKWHSAIDAFVLMYDTVGFDSAATLLKKRGVRRMFTWLYPLFVKHRHKFRYLGGHKLMPWLIRRTAARQAARTTACATHARSEPDQS